MNSHVVGFRKFRAFFLVKNRKKEFFRDVSKMVWFSQFSYIKEGLIWSCLSSSLIFSKNVATFKCSRFTEFRVAKTLCGFLIFSEKTTLFLPKTSLGSNY